MHHERDRKAARQPNVLTALRTDLRDALAYDQMLCMPMLRHPIGNPAA